jgi:large subunit ribosomal protein L24
MRAQIKRGDNVVVISGRERGKTGKVLRVIPASGRATVERLNIVKRHTKPRSQQSQGGIIEKEAPMHLSNLMVLCDRCSKPTRMGKRRLDDGRSVRTCRRCNEQIDR